MKISVRYILLLSLILFFSNIAQAQVSPAPGQGVPIPGGLIQSGDTCQQAAYAMSIVAMGFAGILTPMQVYLELIEIYNGTSSRNCFNAMVTFLANTQNQNVEIVITGAMGGPGKNITQTNTTLVSSTKVKIGYIHRDIGGTHPSGPVVNGTLRIISVTTKGSFFRHSIIVTSVNRDACMVISSMTTPSGTTLNNVNICPVTYWDPANGLIIGSFMTADGAYIQINGIWEQVTGTATISRGS